MKSNASRYTHLALGLVLGLGLALLFLAWAVPEFRDPSFASQYYDQWQAYAQPGDEKQRPEDHFWVSKFYGLAYAEDSLAQWLMAVFSIAATCLSLFALILLQATWRESKRSADAAERTVEITRLTGEAQIRAYLSISGIQAVLLHGGYLRVILSATNGGQTPANDVAVRVLIANLKSTGLNGRAVHQITHPADILPGNENGRVLADFTYPLTTNDRDFLRQSVEEPLFELKGRVWYKPVVGEKRRCRRFRFLLYPPGGSGQEMQIFRSIEGNTSD